MATVRGDICEVCGTIWDRELAMWRNTMKSNFYRNKKERKTIKMNKDTIRLPKELWDEFVLLVEIMMSKHQDCMQKPVDTLVKKMHAPELEEAGFYCDDANDGGSSE